MASAELWNSCHWKNLPTDWLSKSHVNFMVIMKLEKKRFRRNMTLNDLPSNTSAPSEIEVKIVKLAQGKENVKGAGMEEQVYSLRK